MVQQFLLGLSPSNHHPHLGTNRVRLPPFLPPKLSHLHERAVKKRPQGPPQPHVAVHVLRIEQRLEGGWRAAQQALLKGAGDKGGAAV